MFLYGNYTSQWFANYYLQNLDHFIKEKLKAPYYIRYMDDMLVFHRNKKELRKINYLISEYEWLYQNSNRRIFKIRAFKVKRKLATI